MRAAIAIRGRKCHWSGVEFVASPGSWWLDEIWERCCITHAKILLYDLSQFGAKIPTNVALSDFGACDQIDAYIGRLWTP